MRAVTRHGQGLAVALAAVSVPLSVAFSAVVAPPASAFHNRFNLDPVHEGIMSDAFPFLKTSILDTIRDEQAPYDLGSAANSAAHFDGCNFSGGVDLINARYHDAVQLLSPTAPDLAGAAKQFSRALHGIQDFYAHSNWVELGRTDLLDGGQGPWAALTPFATVRGVVVVQGEQPPANMTLSREPANPKIVLVSVANGTVLKGLISGTLPSPDQCPDAVALSHGELNKDEFSRPGFQQARTLALLQTRHEWRRLVALTRSAWGQPGVDALCTGWVDPSPQAQTAAGCINADVVLIIDSSGSMTSNDPANHRLAAGHAYLTASVPGDHVGVVDFDSGVRVASPLRAIPGEKPAVDAAINTIDSWGGTNIGAGVRGGCDVLLASTTANARKAAILLTDGVGSFAGEDGCFRSRGWPIYTFGFGQSDDALLASIAANTGGEFTRLPTSNLVCEFQAVRAKIAGASPGPCTAMTVGPNQSASFPVSVPAGQSQASFSSSWPGSDVVMTLKSPSGRVITRATVALDVVHARGSTFEVYTIANPEPGTWTVTLFGADVPPAGEPVVFGFASIPAPQGQGAADVSIAVACDPGPVAPGATVSCSVTVANAGPGVAHALSADTDLTAGASVVSAPSDGGFSCGTGDPFTCTLSSLAAGASATLTFAWTGLGDVGPGGVLTTASHISSTTTDPVPGNDSASSMTRVVTCWITGAGDIAGTTQNDVICGSSGRDRIWGAAGNDVIFGLGGDDQLFGGDGNDALVGGDGRDELSGDTGDDRLIGSAGADRLLGGVGDDTLSAADGASGDAAVGGDHVKGDRCVVDAGDDLWTCELAPAA